MGEVATPNRLRPVRGFFSWHGYPPRAASTRRPRRAAAGRCRPLRRMRTRSQAAPRASAYSCRAASRSQSNIELACFGVP